VPFFHAHSRFGPEFSTVVLCFHRHSRAVLSILKNPFLLSPEGQALCLWRGEPMSRLFVPHGTSSQMGWGEQQHSAPCSPQDVTPTKLKHTILAYPVPRVKSHNIQSPATRAIDATQREAHPRGHRVRREKQSLRTFPPLRIPLLRAPKRSAGER
jgi:hypothetical protein